MTLNADPSSSRMAAISASRRDNVLILGLRKAGKSSSFQVVYEALNPEDALQEGVTQSHKSEPYDVDTFHPMRIWDGTNNFTSAQISQTSKAATKDLSKKGVAPSSMPSANGAATHEASVSSKGKAAFGTGGQLYWTECSAVIFVVDSQGEYFEALDKLHDVIIGAYASNPLIHFHVFVHKADGHSNDYRNDTLQDIQSRVADNLNEASQSFIFAPTAHEILTEAAAAQDAAAEQQEDAHEHGDMNMASSMRGGGVSALQSNFTSTGLPSGIGPDLEHDVRLSYHVTSILNCTINIAWSRVQNDLMNSEVSHALEAICNGLCSSTKLEKVYLFDVPSKTYIAADSSPFDDAAFKVISDYLTFLIQFSGLYGNICKEKQSTERYSTSNMRLVPDTTLGFHQITANLAFLYVVRNDLQIRNAGMIEYNISIARKAIRDIYDVYRSD